MVRKLWQRSRVLLLLEYIILRLSMPTGSLAPTHDHLFTGSRKSTAHVITNWPKFDWNMSDCRVVNSLPFGTKFSFSISNCLTQNAHKVSLFFSPTVSSDYLQTKNIEKYFLILFNLFKNWVHFNSSRFSYQKNYSS